MEEKKQGGKFKGWITEHKKLSIISLSVFLILCVAAIIVIVALSNKAPSDGDDGNKHPAYNPITKGEDEVVFYRNVANSKVLLTLKNGWYFTVEGEGINKSGEYFLKDNVITLDFVRDEDGTTTATIKNENELDVSLPGSKNSSTFRKMINYTVSFETSEGSTVGSLSILNGETVSEPTAPTKENSTFAGWYKDAGCTIPFRFGADQITANTTIYAKWTSASSSNP